MENMFIYNQSREVPKEAQKPIKGGRLQGFTNINAMWRIKKLTELFGPCGIGWREELTRTWTEDGSDGEVVANVEIALYIKADGGWSAPIPGVGGSKLVVKERGGYYNDDDAYKKAMTDALSVACKSLGVGADVYFAEDRSKYDDSTPSEDNPPKPGEQTPPPSGLICFNCGKTIADVKSGDKTFTAEQIARRTNQNYGHPLCWDCALKADREVHG